jgi:hypothetical protein
MTIRPFTDALRKLGFTEVYRSSAGGQRIIIFEKQIMDLNDPIAPNRRIVEVQLWGDTYHRACHRIQGCSDTTPTDFRTVDEMAIAVQHESSRTDNGWYATGTKAPIKGPVMAIFDKGMFIKLSSE